MAHGITQSDSMVSTSGEVPWHGLGTVLEADHLKSAEINPAAGIDWSVYQSEAYVQIGDRFVLVPGVKHNLRDDNNTVVGTVGERYRVFQNADAPLFLDALVDSSDGEYVTAGSLWGGRKCWWLMRLPTDVTVGGHDQERFQTYLLLSNSHDGSSPIQVCVSTVRVVCQNTLSAALHRCPRMVKIRHTATAADRWAEARRVLDIGFKYSERMQEECEALLSESWDEAGFQTFLDSLVPMPEPDSAEKPGRAHTFATKYQDAIKARYYNTSDLQHLPEWNKYRALQAVAAFHDHDAIRRNTSKGKAEENRFESIFGGQNITSKAFKLLHGESVEDAEVAAV